MALSGIANTYCLAPIRRRRSIQNDVQLRAMADELARTKTLQLNNLDKPYFIQYSTSDSEEMVVAAQPRRNSNSRQGRSRSPRVEIRVGSAEFDNTNSIFSGTSRFGCSADRR